MFCWTTIVVFINVTNTKEQVTVNNYNAKTHYNNNEQQTKTTMNNDYNTQWQYTIQMNNNAQWTTITMTNAWYTLNNELQKHFTMNYNDTEQCKQWRYHDYGNNNNTKCNNTNDYNEQCSKWINEQWQWTMITITMTMNNDYNDNEQWQQCTTNVEFGRNRLFWPSRVMIKLHHHTEKVRKLDFTRNVNDFG